MYNTNFCKVEYLEKTNAIFCKWKQFCKGYDYREPFMHALTLIKEYQITTWITDTSDGFESEVADTKWLLEEFMPMMIDSTVSKIVFIIKDDSLLKNEIEGQAAALREFFEVVLVEEMR